MGTIEKLPVIRAAGAVLWRLDDRGTPLVAVVHRPRYDDWSLPKGKLDADETMPAAAVREVAEETGHSCVLGQFLGKVSYPVSTKRGTADKSVGFFAARVLGGGFSPNSEVDELRWVTPRRARRMLSYGREVEILDRFLALGHQLRTMLLVRHGKAGSREQWNGDDDLRPLSDTGIRQAEALRVLLPLFGPERIHSAPRLRCVQTVRGIADDIGADIVHEPLFSEEGFKADPDAAIMRLRSLAAGEGTSLVCSQGGVIPGLVSGLAERDGIDLGKVPSKKGSLWLLSFALDDDDVRLVAAHYVPSPLPTPNGG